MATTTVRWSGGRGVWRVALLALAVILPSVLGARALPEVVGVDQGGIGANGCHSSSGLGIDGGPDGSAYGYHYVYATGNDVVSRGFHDGCLENAVSDTNGWFGSAGPEDSFGVGEIALYARVGGQTITDPTTGGHTYGNQGDCVSCMST